ncbi:hypothetical protein ACUJ46_06760 [Sandaracinobacteroides sp. A072]|uniref:hypothetical protein n=1 Tax=Sandaracinobacteroides sp. A072 TaxID=3461146 RepID=UPI00404303D5
MRMQLNALQGRLLRAVRSVVMAGNEAAFVDEEKEAAGLFLILEDFSCEPWASLTFRGARHRLDIRLSGPRDAVEAGYEKLRCLPESLDLELAGHFLAELEIVESMGEIHSDDRMGMCITLEALTIEE